MLGEQFITHVGIMSSWKWNMSTLCYSLTFSIVMLMLLFSLVCDIAVLHVEHPWLEYGIFTKGGGIIRVIPILQMLSDNHIYAILILF